ncbi:MAG: hypothetical protein CMM06_08730 [Rhodopirellula sp.]|nr:hypothetical protein [Rhodopirellula sp.]|tara:strand:- start:25641 stop:26117 length:477 start_codon:yes stop_codon:yes gene_type:complete
MQLQTSCGILTGLLVALTVGCQSNSGVTRVPAPQTGVVGTGGGAYYSNKNSSNASYAPAGSTRSARGDSWSPRARGPIENIASNPDGRQISYEEPVGQDEPEVIRIPVRTQEQNRVNDSYRESGLQPLQNPIELETPPPSADGAVLKEEGGDNWVSRQ